MDSEIHQCIRWGSNQSNYVSAYKLQRLLIISHNFHRWGESAGAISVGLHLIANNGNNEGLFRAAFMESGSFLSVGDITEGQDLYDTIVEETGCAGTADTLQCLRDLPFDVLKAAIDKSPGIFDFQVREFNACQVLHN